MIDLVIFTCEGREHLLLKSYESFKSVCDYKFDKTILVIDGPVDADIIAEINPNLVIQHTQRRGYVNSILEAIKLISTEYFFWLEDDFIFNQEVPMPYILETIKKQKNWGGIFLSRNAPFTQSEKKHHHFDNFYIPDFGYSVSPTLCRTNYIKQAFTALINYPKSEETKYYGFEPFIDDFFIANNISYALLDPGAIAHVNHIGQLENTGREYHMINSIDEKTTLVNKKYISNFGKDRKITTYNKIAMLPKLWFSVFILSFKLLKHRRAYDMAFRIYIAFLKNFKF
jgi:hypothetical protein